ncbi:TMEM165/GDT1 family protein [Luteithermobacter gelatinilyticus]|uniref:TMEM165/GDT1 family protein n=1 Tax=Luteithermobacter gelatinilyticus TaxID=2582913 RepID=UPI0011066261|nr:TMEM165/GDT1 family protein [Luteithermobacter gelatinilyticus]|tara:strand:- start:602 stop:1174 length:573 start_codon:yes stop_codon:yes gene_type:complete
MDALLTSTFSVALAEIGDKTQLLSLVLATRFSNRIGLIAGIFLATVINHAPSAWFGELIAGLISVELLSWIVGGSFLLMAGWLLIPDHEDEEESRFMAYGAFLASLILFFIAEIGDKTQVATVLLGARYEPLGAVVVGSTLGMMIANVPVIYAGNWLMQRLPLNAARWGASLLFVGIGLWTLLEGQKMPF